MWHAGQGISEQKLMTQNLKTANATPQKVTVQQWNTHGSGDIIYIYNDEIR